MKKATKKDTNLSVLQEIRDILKSQSIVSNDVKKTDEITVNIPEGLTAKDIYEQSENKTSTGTPLLFNIDWYKYEPFFCREKTTKKTVTVSRTITHKNKSWDECKIAMEKEGGIMLSFAEWLYIIWSHEKETGERLFNDWEYLWTSSRASGGRLVLVGGFDGEGADVNGDSPGRRFGRLGVSFSRSLNTA